MNCGAHDCLGGTCHREQGHNGAHRTDYGREWTDESDRATANAIAESMRGRTE